MNFLTKTFFAALTVLIFPARPVTAQVLMSAGTYTQNFDSLASSGTVGWTNNVTLPGWYLAKNGTNAISYITGTGSGTTGGHYSFGVAGVNAATDRALGSLASGSATPVVYGVRFTNDTGLTVTNIAVSYTGEQWRNGGSGSASILAFSYGGSATPITNAVDATGWTNFTPLNFTTPTVSTSFGALDGNNATNRQVFAGVILTNVIVPAGQEIFLRWLDVDDAGNDSALAIDDLTVSFQTTTNSPGGGVSNAAPSITLQPQNQAANENGFAILTVAATGSPAPAYQWRRNGTDLPGATGATLALYNLNTNQAGSYSVCVTNIAGATNSAAVQLSIIPVSLSGPSGAIKYLTYNVAGNGVADWSTNTTQAQAIGRELMYWQPDVVTFNEIPTNGVALMPDWMKAFLPGYYLATNSTSDGFIQSCIASRWPILRSQSWLKFSSLAPFGYTGTAFTRDLFEAQIAVPNWPLPLHAFVAHLKATGTSNPQGDADKRAAMASAVSNFFVTVYLAGTNATHPYVLSGDMNEDAFFPDKTYTSGQPIQRMTSVPTGLQMTVPVNPVTHTDLTESIQGSLDTRFDYILPSGLLFSNLAGMQVFRTDLLTNFPANLFSNDDKLASDHLPVLMVFNNPFNTPFKLLSVARTSQNLTLQWESQYNRSFNIEASTNLADWTPFVTNLQTSTTNSPFVFATNDVADRLRFFRIYRVP
jgi:endonuclease/exonuclease/phosphatase family metal-dependent hydrolase